MDLSDLQGMPPGIERQGQRWKDHYWPNKMGRMMLLAFEDVMSHSAVNAMLDRAHLGHRVNNYPPDNCDQPP